MTIEDIFNTLSHQNMILARESTPPPVRPSPGQSIKFPKGRKNGIARRHLHRTQTNDSKVEVPKGPFVVPTHYEISWDNSKVDEYLRAWEAKGYFKIKSEKLQWSPYILARSETKGEEKKEEVEKEMDESVKGKGMDGKEARPSLANSGDDEGVSAALTTGPSTPSGMPYKTPLGLFDDEVTNELPVLATQETHKSKSKSRSRSKSTLRSRSRSGSRSRTKSPSVERPESNGIIQQEQQEVQMEEPLVEVEEVSKRPVRGRQSKVSKMAIPTPKREPPEPRITRRRGGALVSENPNTRMADGDKALAARLALEERNQGRNLRSRASTSGLEQKRTSSALPTPRTVTSRKRRRIDSPPEQNRSVSVGGSPLPVAFVNGKHRKGKVNGKVTVRDVMPIVVPDDMVKESQLRKPEIIGDVNHGGENVKPEEIGTPLTSLTSRQSLPSDDTVFVTEAVNQMLMNGKGGTGMLEGGEREVVDVDADGEYEEDAEGEPDADEDMEDCS